MNRHVYKPMLAKVVAEAFSNKDWIFEIKWDGFRAIAYIGTQLSLKSRNEKELKYSFPELKELTELASTIVVDGEIVVMTEGKPDFETLLERGQAVSDSEIQRQRSHPCFQFGISGECRDNKRIIRQGRRDFLRQIKSRQHN